MDFITLLLTAVGLSMDAFSVALCKGLSVKKAQVKQGLLVGLYFGFFQALMPLVGYLLGGRFYRLIQDWDHWVAFVLLLILGINMIREAKDQEDLSGGFAPKDMLPLAIATSIDALIVGVSFAVLKVSIYRSISFIGLWTFLLSFVGFYLGHYFGQKWEKWAHVLGGILLILIGAKVLLEDLGYLG